MATGAISLERTAPARPGWLRDRTLAARFAWFVVGYNVLVVLWGAVVRATSSGAGCGNNWPLCNGQVIPLSPTTHTMIEFTHRMMVGGSLVPLLLMIAWTWTSTAAIKGAAARWFAVASFLLTMNEAFLGALLVKLGYVTGNKSVGRMILLSVHLSNTLVLLAALTLTAWLLGTGQRWRELRARGLDRTIALTGLLATLIVGVSGSLAALGDTLFPASSLRAAFAQDLAPGSPWLLRLRGVHPLSAFLAAAFVVWLMVRARRAGEAKWANLVLALLGLQFVLGVADVLLLAPAWMQIVHLLGADLYWVALIATAAKVVWPAPATTLAAINS
jgi:cytochrome c oxidase assembly protein subunit 15